MGSMGTHPEALKRHYLLLDEFPGVLPSQWFGGFEPELGLEINATQAAPDFTFNFGTVFI